MKAAIVTGGTGFIGRAVISELLAHNYKVYAIVREGRESQLPSNENCLPIVGDLDDMLSLLAKVPNNSADVFFHLAWTGTSGTNRFDTRLQLKNAQLTVDNLRVAKLVGCKRFVCAGSIMEHETTAVTFAQGSRPSLGYIYGSGKLAAHAMCRSVASSINIDLLWASITNAYGIGESSSRLINSTIKKCILGQTPAFTSGTQNYDFIYIDDVARCFRLIAEKGHAFHDYCIGSGKAKPLKDFLIEMNQAIAPDLKFRFGAVPFNGVNLPLSQFDCSETENHTGFKPEISFTDGCCRTYEWWKQNLIKAQAI